MKTLKDFGKFINEDLNIGKVKMILDAPCESPGSKFPYRWVLEVNRQNLLESVLKVEQEFPPNKDYPQVGGWQGTPGQWYVGTLLNKDGYGVGVMSNMIYIDAGQKWYVIGLLDALKEVKEKLGIE